MGEVMEVETIIPDAHLFDTEDEEYPCPQIMSFTVHGPLFFGAADRFDLIITRSINERPAVLILKLRHVSIIDVTGEANLSSLDMDFQKMGGTVLISEIEDDPLEMLQMSGLSEVIGHEHFFKTTTEAINYVLTLIDAKNCPTCSSKSIKQCQTFIQKEDH